MDDSKRPWGEYEILKNTAQCKVKIIIVNPGHRLSYQYHHKRDENWTVIEGMAKVTVDDLDYSLNVGEHIFIKRKQKHRVANVGNGILKFVEVQTGEYFGEDDIVRIEDDYRRM